MGKEYEPKRFQKETTVLADQNMIPTLKKTERFQMRVTPFKDHGRPCFIGSAIKSNSTFTEVATALNPDESRRANERFNSEVERILDGNETRRVAVLTASGKPDVYVLSAGESFDPKSIRIYYTRGEFKGAPAILQIARAKLKDTRKIERILEDSGYQATKNWEKRRVH